VASDEVGAEGRVRPRRENLAAVERALSENSRIDLDPRKTALLCLDVQQFTVEHLPPARREALLTAIKRALDGARRAGVQIIYVVAERRADFSSRRNKFTRGRPAPVDPAEVAARTRIPDDIAPMHGEPVVRKPRMSAFYASPLDSMLRSKDIDTVVLTGLSTNFVVESTVRAAVDMDYRVIVLEDGVTAGDEAVHRAALTSMGPLADIVSVEDFLTGV
jgi:biuret amidohydrolase